MKSIIFFSQLLLFVFDFILNIKHFRFVYDILMLFVLDMYLHVLALN
jgi:hypothetical protein